MEGTNAMLEGALQYYERGWSIIPMKMADKRPAVRWKRYQEKRAPKRIIRRWFKGGERGIAVVFGAISGGLISRDFDTMESYEHWAAAHPDLAATLPTVATRRGRHVYATATAEHIADFRKRIGKPDGTGAVQVWDGELRCGVGCYSVVPPSVHPSGHIYRWELPLPEGQLPEVDVFAAGFYSEIDRERTGVLRGTEAMNARWGERSERVGNSALAVKNEASNALGPLWTGDIHEAVIGSLPDGPGKRHKQVFQLARALQGVQELKGVPLQDMRPYVECWHALAQDVITTQPFEETWIDFLRGWPNVKFPKGADRMTAIMERVDSTPLPPETERYELPGLKKLVSVCRELQRSQGDAPFYLGCRIAAEVLGTSRTTANGWLFLLIFDGILELVDTGDYAQRKAARYHYLGQL